MADEPAKIYSDQADVAIYLGDSGDGFTLPFKDKWRTPDAVAAVIGFIGTGAAVTAHLDDGHPLALLVGGAALTGAAVGLLSRLPVGRPSLPTRLIWCWHNLIPRVHATTTPETP
jgi:hypothetical protein